MRLWYGVMLWWRLWCHCSMSAFFSPRRLGMILNPFLLSVAACCPSMFVNCDDDDAWWLTNIVVSCSPRDCGSIRQLWHYLLALLFPSLSNLVATGVSFDYRCSKLSVFREELGKLWTLCCSCCCGGDDSSSINYSPWNWVLSLLLFFVVSFPRGQIMELMLLFCWTTMVTIEAIFDCRSRHGQIVHSRCRRILSGILVACVWEFTLFLAWLMGSFWNSEAKRQGSWSRWWSQVKETALLLEMGHFLSSTDKLERRCDELFVWVGKWRDGNVEPRFRLIAWSHVGILIGYFTHERGYSRKCFGSINRRSLGWSLVIDHCWRRVMN